MEEKSDKEDSSRNYPGHSRTKTADKSMRESVMNLKMQKQLIAQSFMDDKPRSSIKRASLKYANPSGVDAEEL